MDPAAANRMRKALVFIKVFTVTSYIALAIIVFLFLVLGVPWIMDYGHYNNGGAGTVLALLYIAPLIIVGLLILTIFIVISVIVSTYKKYAPATIMKKYKPCVVLFAIVILALIIAITTVYIPVLFS